MAKQKTAFVCNDCGSDYAKWQGQCSDCGAWNTLAEIRLGPATSGSRGAGRAGGGAGANRAGFAGALAGARILKDIDLDELPRFSSGVGEFDRVLGGGLVPGSAVLVGGNPGAGKSTLLLQTMCHLAAGMEALYITGEESLQQVAMRANRLGLPTDKLRMMSETNVETIVGAASSDTVVFGAAVTTRSPPITASASPAAMRIAVMSAGLGAIRQWIVTAPPFWARPAMSIMPQPLSSRCAAMPSSAPTVITPVPPMPVMRML